MKLKRVLMCLFTAALFLAGCQNNKETGETTRAFSSVDVNPGLYTVSDNGFMWINLENRLSYLDFASGETVYLCNKEGCRHTSADCNARVDDIGGRDAFFYNGSLYILGYGFNQNTLWKANADGTNRKAVISENPGGMSTDMLLVNGKLYYAAINSVEPKEGEHVTAMKQYGVVVECDLKKEKSRVIASYEDRIGTLVKSMYTDGENIYYLVHEPSEDISEIFAESNEEGTDFSEKLEQVQMSCRLYCYNLRSGVTDLLMEESIPCLSQCMLLGADAEKGCFLYTEKKGFYWLKDNKEESVTLDEDILDMILTEDYMIFYNILSEQIRIYDKDTGENLFSGNIGAGNNPQLLGCMGTKLCFFQYSSLTKMKYYDIDLNELIAGNETTLHLYE